MPDHHFTPKEQYVIAHMAIAGFSLREIGRRLGRCHTSISREIRRNRPTYADDAVYWYDAAEYYAKERRHKPRHRRRQHEMLRDYVTSKLRIEWPPEAITGRLKVDYPDDAEMRISHETIYQNGPGRSTRHISAAAARKSGMCSRVSMVIMVSKKPATNPVSEIEHLKHGTWDRCRQLFENARDGSPAHQSHKPRQMRVPKPW